MTLRKARALLAFAMPVLLAAALTACGDDDDTAASEALTPQGTVTPTEDADPAEEADPTEEATAAPSEEPTPTEAPTEATTQEPTSDPNQISVEVVGGAVTGGAQRFAVALGSSVTITVTADISDEVHLHGYDFTVDIAPGAPATISLTADIPGVFEAELENSGLPILELEVS